MQSTEKIEDTRREDINHELKRWADKKAHFEKTGNKDGIKVSNLMLDKYLDSLLNLQKNI